ncbi:hypothetical protein [Nocardia terpenica]|uniref:hypothetical protein n=1 Tax=Nocardia terpenica TaxID=455432 RepID=UPI0012FDDA96|nr:hypothetical protein [Nocardia terpenica]
MPTSPAPDHDTAAAIEAIRTLVQAQNLRDAKQELRGLQARTDDQTWLIITEIANTLRFKTHAAALAKLRNLWYRNEPHRAIIEACVPKPREGQYIPKMISEGRPSPRENRPLPGTVGEAYEDELAKGERDDPGTLRPELIVDRHDYDENAVSEVRGPLCVSCRTERAAIDRWTTRSLAGHGDDGLCGECRSLGRPGIPELPLGHSYIQAVHARLEFLAETFQTRARGIFRQEWRYADAEARVVIERWVSKHTAEPAPPTSPVELIELNGTCQKCGDWRQLRDELCVECHPGVGGADVTPAGSIAPGHSADGVSIRTLRNEIEDGHDQHRRPGTATSAEGPEQQRSVARRQRSAGDGDGKQYAGSMQKDPSKDTGQALGDRAAAASVDRDRQRRVRLRQPTQRQRRPVRR